ncbi:MAG: Holliday junction resolvase RuvX [Thermodesulfobacteriota bacterium]
MRTLALDVGTKTIGVAVSDQHGITANGLTTIKRREIKNDLDALSRIIDEYKPFEILIGIPYNIDGAISERGKGILNFANILKRTFSLNIELWDESYSTADAEKVLLEANLSRKKRKRVIDKMAAVVILQDYLEQKRNKGG